MSYGYEEDDEWDDYDDDWSPGMDDDDESYTVDCPECGAEVYEDAERCPSCGSYIILSSSGSVWQGRPAWWIILGLLGIIAVILALVPL